ncbi:heme oxygenase-like protein [Agrocybe pediades]|nr:heme oxygenase-like protein [Agrocybe pediades]
MSTKLTEHLLSISTLPPYAAATRHSFLTQARNSTLPDRKLSLWLSQDRIYAAHAYPRFIGALISHIPFTDSDAVHGDDERRKQRILEVLVGCLDNIVREVRFFQDTAAEFGLQIEGWPERKGTRDYTAEMARISLSGSLEDGLVFLWAMEQVYFDAWNYVKQGQPASTAIDRFASNWSSPEFAVFVSSLADLVNDLGIIPGSQGWSKAEDIWRRVIELEVGFWPDDNE